MIKIAVILNTILFFFGYYNLLRVYEATRPVPALHGLALGFITFVAPYLFLRLCGTATLSWVESVEMALSFAVFSALFRELYHALAAKKRNTTSHDIGALTFLCILIFFARTDYIIFSFVFFGTAIVHLYRNDIKIRVNPYWAGLIVVGGAATLYYLYLNKTVAGSFVQISGQAKSYYATLGAEGIFGDMPNRVNNFVTAIFYPTTAQAIQTVSGVKKGFYPLTDILGPVGLVATQVMFYLYGLRYLKGPLKRATLAGLAGIIIFTTIHLLREWVEVRNWYFAALYFLMFLLTFEGLNRLKPKTAKILLGVCVALSLWSVFISLKMRSTYAEKTAEFDKILSAYGDDVVAGYPNSGLYGFFSSHRIVNLDGLVSDKAYLEALGEGTAACLLFERGTNLVVLPEGYIAKKPYTQFADLPNHKLVEGNDIYRLEKSACKG